MSEPPSQKRARATPPRAGRADARRNREHILRIAREAYATRGIDVPMTTIARLAGVGVATLYRHFASRDELVAQVFAKELDQCSSLLDAALADPDPWFGFCEFIERMCAMQTANPGFTEAFLTQPPPAIVAASRREGARDLAELVRRAKATGRLRADFVESDIIVLLLANSALMTSELPAGSSPRLVAYMLQSFAAVDAPRLPPVARIDLARLLSSGQPTRSDPGP